MSAHKDAKLYTHTGSPEKRERERVRERDTDIDTDTDTEIHLNASRLEVGSSTRIVCIHTSTYTN